MMDEDEFFIDENLKYYKCQYIQEYKYSCYLFGDNTIRIDRMTQPCWFRRIMQRFFLGTIWRKLK